MHIAQCAHKPFRSFARSLTRISSTAWINACNVIGRWKKVCVCVCVSVYVCKRKSEKKIQKKELRVNRKWLRKKCIGNVARAKKKSNGCYKEQMKIVSSAAMRYHSFSQCFFAILTLAKLRRIFPFFWFFYNLAVVSRSPSPFSLCLNCHILSLFHFIFPSLQLYFPNHPLSNSRFIRFIYFSPYLCVCAVYHRHHQQKQQQHCRHWLLCWAAGNGCSAIQLMITWKVETFVKRSLYFRFLRFFLSRWLHVHIITFVHCVCGYIRFIVRCFSFIWLQTHLLRISFAFVSVLLCRK